jgi:hypothetical protein
VNLAAAGVVIAARRRQLPLIGRPAGETAPASDAGTA